MRSRLFALLILLPALPASAQTLTPYASESTLVAVLSRHARMRDSLNARALSGARARCDSDSPVAELLARRGEANPTVIVGTVRGNDGAPLSGALVGVDTLRVETLTGDDGVYRLVIPAVAGDSAQGFVRAIRLGLAPACRRVVVARGDSLRADLSLASGAIEISGLVLTAQAAGESITSTQHDGVDEGGIVKVHGGHLVVLRRGRLFTVEIGGRRLSPISAVDAYPPGARPGSFYDEMLIYGDRVVVIGLGEEGTELNLFDIDRRGRLTFQSSYRVRSDDYYSSRNYASRLIGSRLILYSPLYLGPVRRAADLHEWLPAMGRWRAHDKRPLRPTLSAARVFAPGRDLAGVEDLTLHTVTACDLSRRAVTCESTALVGPEGRVFYVSPTAVYLWVTDWTRRGERDRAGAMIFRMPLDGRNPTALAASGSPIDQFSFLERNDTLSVVVDPAGEGDGMWSAERSRGDLALLRVPLALFGDGSGAAPLGSYLSLPRVPPDAGVVNRFVGSMLLYGGGNPWGSPGSGGGTLHALRLGQSQATTLRLPHAVDRIEAMGVDAIVVGSAPDGLHFTGVALAGTPRAVQHYLEPGAAQGETRSHGFYYRIDAEGGTVGLPVSRPPRPGYRQLWDESSAVIYLRNADGGFRLLGELAAHPGSARDGCKTSCADWYGSSRPIFLRGRVFALLGYELVEGRIGAGRIREIRRVSFAPPASGLARR